MTDKKQAWTAGGLVVAETKPRTGARWDIALRSTHDFSPVASVYAAGHMVKYAKPNAERLAECWNALAGIDDPVEWRKAVMAVVEYARAVVWVHKHDQTTAITDLAAALLALQQLTEEETSDGR